MAARCCAASECGRAALRRTQECEAEEKQGTRYDSSKADKRVRRGRSVCASAAVASAVGPRHSFSCQLFDHKRLCRVQEVS